MSRTERSPMCIWLQGLETGCVGFPLLVQRSIRYVPTGSQPPMCTQVRSQGTWYCRLHFLTSLTLWLLSSCCDKVDEALLSLYLSAPPRKSHTRCFLRFSYKCMSQAGLTAYIDLRSKTGCFQFLISTYWGLLEWGTGISFKDVMHKPPRPKC